MVDCRKCKYAKIWKAEFMDVTYKMYYCEAIDDSLSEECALDDLPCEFYEQNMDADN